MHLPSVVLAALCILAHRAGADTEIVNFSPELSNNVDVEYNAATWRVLQVPSSVLLDIAPAPRQDTEHLSCNFTLQACPHELWLVLDATSGGMHTVRISYAATSSVAFNIEVFPHAALVSYATAPHTSPTSSTRRAYARITSRRVGVLSRGTRHTEPPSVAFHVAFERLLFGAIPPSTLPVIAAAIAALGVVGYSLPTLLAAFDRLARDARNDLWRKGQ